MSAHAAAPARPGPISVMARKAPKIAPIDEGLRPDGAIDPNIYWGKRVKEHPVIYVPLALLDPKLGLRVGALVTFARMAFYGGKRGRCDPSHATLGEELSRSDRTIGRDVTQLRTAKLITSWHRPQDFGGRLSDEYLPIWHHNLEGAFRDSSKEEASVLTIGQWFSWKLFRFEKYPSLMLPLQVVSDVSAGAALFYGVLCRVRFLAGGKRHTISALRSNLAGLPYLGGRLTKESVGYFLRELQRNKWVRIEVSPSGPRLSFLYKRPVEKCPVAR